MEIILIICAVITLLDVVAVGAIMKNSSKISRLEETALAKSELVKCKDCKHYFTDKEGDWCCKSFNSFRTTEDNYCKFGERMDKE